MVPRRRTDGSRSSKWRSGSSRTRHLALHRRRLAFEPLEVRRLLSITVNTPVDENNGIGIGAGTSLREAIAAAPAGETINFSVVGTIHLANLG